MLETYNKIINSWEKNFKLIIAWPCWQDWEKYQEIIDKYNLSKNILRIDWFISEQETWELFTLSDVLILPYKDFDSQSWVIATNLYFNLPVIVSNLWWLTAVIKDKDLIFEVWNTDELKEKILNLFSWNNLELKKEYLKSLKKDFEWDNIVEKTLEFYKK
jgi:glycosyltransferase involved in cell wall biosynthesis